MILNQIFLWQNNDRTSNGIKVGVLEFILLSLKTKWDKQVLDLQQCKNDQLLSITCDSNFVHKNYVKINK